MTRPRKPKPNPDRQRGPQGTDLYKQAHRDVMLSLKPFLQTLRRTGRQATQQTNQTNQRVQDVYGALGTQLSGLDAPYQQTMAGIGNNLASQTSSLAPLLQSSVGQAPQTETAAGQGLLGAIGSGGLSQLASQAGTNVGYNTSAQRQGIEESAITQRNALADLGNFRQDLGQQRTDIMRQAGPQTLQRLDQLKQQQLDRYLAMQQLALQRTSSGLQVDQFNFERAQAQADAAAYAAWLALQQNGP